MKKIFFIMLVLSFNIAIAEPINFECDGTTFGQNILTTPENFPLIASTQPPEIYGYPSGKALGCMDGFKTTASCTTTEMVLKCNCKNDMATSTITLSRTSGKLHILNLYTSDNQIIESKMICKKLNKSKRLF